MTTYNNKSPKDSILYINLLQDLGSFYLTWHNSHTKASFYYNKALDIYRFIGDTTSKNYFACLDNYASLLKSQGNVFEAIKVSNKVLSNFHPKTHGDSSDLIIYLDHKIENLCLIGEIDSALQTCFLLKEYFNTNVRWRTLLAYTNFLNEFAEIKFRKNEFDTSIEILKYTLSQEDIYMPNDSTEHCYTLYKISNIYAAVNKFDSAEKYCKAAINRRSKKDISYSEYSSFLSYIFSKQPQGSTDKILRLELEALDNDTKVYGNKSIQVSLDYYRIGYLLTNLNEYKLASQYLFKSLKLLHDICEANINLISNENKFNYIHKYMYVYDDISKIILQKLVKYIPEKEDGYLLQVAYINELFWKNFSTRQLTKNAFYSHIQKMFSEKFISIELQYNILTDKSGQSIEDTFGLASYLYTPASDNLTYTVETGSAKFWEQFIYNSSDSIKINRIYGQGDDNYGKLIQKFLFEPWKNIMSNDKEVFIAPSGIFYGINIAAIPWDDSFTVGEKYKIHILNSTTYASNYTATYLTPKTLKLAVIFGDVDYDNANQNPSKIPLETYYNSYPQLVETTIRSLSSKFGHLIGTKQEAKNVNLLCSNNHLAVQSYTGENATEANLKSFSGKKDPFIIHIATHGFFFRGPTENKSEATISNLTYNVNNIFKLNDDPMLRSGLVFAGANKYWGHPENLNDSTEDGILTSYEISNLDLHSCQLVVLSACETGLGDIKGSEGVFGLQRAFKMAGVKNIIMSLWKVPDKETQELMTLFYNYCFAGKSVHDALQAAQTDMRKKGYAPYYWAAWKLLE